MATISVQAKLTSDELLNALAQLDTSEAEHILRRRQQLLAQRKVPFVPQREAELLQFVAREKWAGFAERFTELQAKRLAPPGSPRQLTHKKASAPLVFSQYSILHSIITHFVPIL